MRSKGVGLQQEKSPYLSAMINSRASTDQHVALSTCGIVATGRSLAGPARSGAIQGAPSVRGPTAVFDTGMRPAFGWLADLGGRWAVGRPGGWSSRAYPASGLPENHDFECDGDLRSRAMPDLPGAEESADSDVYPPVIPCCGSRRPHQTQRPLSALFCAAYAADTGPPVR